MGKIFLGNTQIGVTPVGNQDISTLDEYNVSSKATARISAEERAKIIPGNIKKDVTILGTPGALQSEGAILGIKYTEGGLDAKYVLNYMPPILAIQSEG